MLKKFQNIQGNIIKLYIYNTLLGMFFIVPVIVLFWQEKGLSMTEIMLLQSFFAIAVVALEIPTGYLADLYSRKKVLVFSSLFWLIGMIIYSVASNFYEFLIGEIFLALAISFSSGTASAFVYDTLVALKREGEFKKIWGNILFYSLIALGLSNMLGGFIAHWYGFQNTLYATIPFFLGALGVSMTLIEPERHKTIISENYVKNLLKVIQVNLIEKKLRWIMFYSGVIVGFNQSALWLYQPYFQLTHLDIVYFGMVFASFQVVAAFSSKYAYKVEEFFGAKTSLVSLIFLVGLSYVLMSNFVFLFSFSFAFLHQFVRGFRQVVITDYINKMTRSENRATILSVESFIGRIIYASIIPGIGYTVDAFSLVQALELLAIITLLSGGIMMFFLKRNRVI